MCLESTSKIALCPLVPIALGPVRLLPVLKLKYRTNTDYQPVIRKYLPSGPVMAVAELSRLDDLHGLSNGYT